MSIDDYAERFNTRDNVSYHTRTMRLTVSGLYLPSANDNEIREKADVLAASGVLRDEKVARDFVEWREKDLLERYQKLGDKYRQFYRHALACLKKEGKMQEFFQTYLTSGETQLIGDYFVKRVDIEQLEPSIYGIDFGCSPKVNLCTALDLFQEALRCYCPDLFERLDGRVPSSPDNGLTAVILTTRVQLETTGAKPGVSKLLDHLYARRCSHGSNGGRCPNQAAASSWFCPEHDPKAHLVSTTTSKVKSHSSLEDMGEFLSHLATCPECQRYYMGLAASEHLRCARTTRGGRRCKSLRMEGSEYCSTHEEEDFSAKKTALLAGLKRCEHVTATGRRCKHDKSWHSSYCEKHTPEKLPADEVRCIRKFGHGARCKDRKVKGTEHCAKHQPKVPIVPVDADRCIYETVSGRRCKQERLEGTEHCERHQPKAEYIPPDDERCIRRFGHGSRCKGERLQGTEHCERHQPKAKAVSSRREPLTEATQCTKIKRDGSRCGQRRKVGFDLCAGCLTNARGGPPPDAERCIKRRTRGRCTGQKEPGSDYCAECNPSK